MPIQVHQFSCLSDNYGYLVRDEATGQAAAIDTPDAEAVAGGGERDGLDPGPDPQHPLAPGPRRRQCGG